MGDLELQLKDNWQIEAMYHKHWLAKVKKETKAKHAIFVKEPDAHFIHVHFFNETGGTDKIKYKLEGAPKGLRDFDYESLIGALKNRKK